jgi:hypothetical protein
MLFHFYFHVLIYISQSRERLATMTTPIVKCGETGANISTIESLSKITEVLLYLYTTEVLLYLYTSKYE